MPPAYATPYVIQPNDELRIVVLGSPDLTSTSPVRPDGTVTVPGAGEVQAGGRSPSELSEIIESRLTDIIRQPQVDVLVTETTPPRVFVAGEVFSSGARDFRPGLTMLQAMTLAGPRSTAKMTSVLLMRRTGPDEITVRRINVKDVVNGKEGAVDPRLAPDDVIFIPKSFVASWAQFMNDFIRTASFPLDLYTSAWFAANVANQNVRITFR
jgi:polysaccharide export outer membrane protein